MSRLLTSIGLLALALAWPLRASSAQSQLVLSQDFESGLGTWTVSGANPFGWPQVQWHVAPPGECGADTALAAYNGMPLSCNHWSASFGDLFSPDFILPAADSHVIRFAYARDMHPVEDVTEVMIGNPFEGYVWLAVNLDNAATLTSWSLETRDLGPLAGTKVRIFFTVKTSSGNPGTGWKVDDVTLRTGAWTDLGQAKPGSDGTPTLIGSGLLEAGLGVNHLALRHAKASSPATLVAGLAALNAPFKGGTLVPFPGALVTLATTAAGSVDLDFGWPAAAPAGTTLYVQYWIADGARFAASNALKGTSSS